jgi:negative regulator of flagellin synthesis FlgM
MMKIVGQQPNPLPEASTSREAAAARTRTGTSAPAEQAAGGEDRVEVSSLARTLASLRSEIGDPEAIDTERVTQLRSAIANGTYDPPASEVADALLRELASNRLV